MPVAVPPPYAGHVAHTTNPAPGPAFALTVNGCAVPTPDDVRLLYEDSESQASSAPHSLSLRADFGAKMQEEYRTLDMRRAFESTIVAVPLLH